MKIIKAKQSGVDRVAYINASRIDSFYATKMDESTITKIYFGDHKCEIEGDKTIAIAHFMSGDDDCGFLDLTVDERPRRCERKITLEDIKERGVLTGVSSTSIFMKGDNKDE